MSQPRPARQVAASEASVELPPHELACRQAAWLSPLRSRLLRRIHVARRRSILDLGAGSGAVTGELVRRGGGPVVAVDAQWTALSGSPDAFSGAQRVVADAASLPFASERFDLVFCQFALLWMEPVAALAEVHRVLSSGGVLLAIEPDYENMIEYPEPIATQPLWTDALRRSGADPAVARKLPGILARLGMQVRVDLIPELQPASVDRFALLRGLPLSNQERARLDEIERRLIEEAAPWSHVVHLPLFLITSTKPGRND